MLSSCLQSSSHFLLSIIGTFCAKIFSSILFTYKFYRWLLFRHDGMSKKLVRSELVANNWISFTSQIKILFFSFLGIVAMVLQNYKVHSSKRKRHCTTIIFIRHSPHDVLLTELDFLPDSAAYIGTKFHQLEFLYRKIEKGCKDCRMDFKSAHKICYAAWENIYVFVNYIIIIFVE